VIQRQAYNGGCNFSTATMPAAARLSFQLLGSLGVLAITGSQGTLTRLQPMRYTVAGAKQVSETDKDMDLII